MDAVFHPALLLAGPTGPVEEWLHAATLLLTHVAEAIGAAVIAVGVLRAFALWVGEHLPRRGGEPITTERIRLGLGRSLGLALEFLLAADILSTAVAPSWEAIGKLAAIATIRTLLNHFLGKELAHEEQRRRAGLEPTLRPDGE